MNFFTAIGYILNLTGAVVLFLFGMKIMSEALQKVAGNKLRYFMRTLTYDKGRAILTGFLITSLIQSSSAFTVMTVGLVNAGLVSLTQSFGLIMGANIGTTVTAWLVTFFGFSIKIQSLLLPMLALAFPLLFAKKATVRYTGEIVFGFVILFLGLNFLKEIMPDISQNHWIASTLSKQNGNGFRSLLFFVLTGFFITLIFQSSSAMFTFTLIMSINGFITFDAAAAMILGENIGTTATANITALIANRDGKRAAFFHFLFNVSGVFWALIFFHPFVNTTHFITGIFNNFLPINKVLQLSVGLSVFHSLFNICNTLIFVWFIPKIVVFTKKIIPDKATPANHPFMFVPNNIMSTTELSLLQASKELSENAMQVKNMFNTIPELLMEKEKTTFNNIYKTLKNNEAAIDKNEAKLYGFLTKISEGELSAESARMIRGFVVSIDNIETIGDLCFKTAKLIKEKNKHRAWFIQKQRDELFEMFKLVDKALRLMIKNINFETGKIDEKTVLKTEHKINKKRDKMIMDFHTYQIKNNLPYESGQYYLKFVELCEKIGDHAINVSEALAGHKFYR